MTTKTLNNLQSNLTNFIGTTQYYHIKPFNNFLYTDGFKYFIDNAGNGALWFYYLVATEILPKLKDDLFFIDLKVNKDSTAKITAFRDTDEPLLFEKDIEFTDCQYSETPYEFCIDVYNEQQIFCLLSER